MIEIPQAVQAFLHEHYDLVFAWVQQREEDRAKLRQALETQIDRLEVCADNATLISIQDFAAHIDEL